MKNNKAKEKAEMKSLVTILNELIVSGYETQFKAITRGLLSLKTRKVYTANEVKVIHFYRFEGESNPSDNSIVYAIETVIGEKGTLVDGYGTASDSNVTEFMSKVDEINK